MTSPRLQHVGTVTVTCLGTSEKQTLTMEQWLAGDVTMFSDASQQWFQEHAADWARIIRIAHKGIDKNLLGLQDQVLRNREEKRPRILNGKEVGRMEDCMKPERMLTPDR